MRGAKFFIVMRDGLGVRSGRKSNKVGYGGTISQLLGKKDGTPVSVFSFSVKPGFRDDDRGVWVSHIEPETVYVAEGQFHYSMVSPDGSVHEEITVRAGDVLYVAPGTYHRGHGIGRGAYKGLVFCPRPLDGEMKSIFTGDSKMRNVGGRNSAKAKKNTATTTH